MKRGFFAGAFDLLHPGYLKAMREAVESGACDTVVIGLDENPAIDRPWKRPPVFTVQERKEMLLAVRWVSKVHPYRGQAGLVDLLKQLKPDVRILGSDYRDPKVYEANLAGHDPDLPLFFSDRVLGWSASEFLARLDRRQDVEKAWGKTRCIQQSTDPWEPELWLAHGKAGGRSSVHLHQSKRNDFFVVSGKLRVREIYDGGESVHELRERDHLIIPPGTMHEMSFPTEATVLEVYFSTNGKPADSGDIVRLG